LDIRGNVDTRIRKVKDPDGPYDATILAYAGLRRLGLTEVVSELLPLDLMLPAPGQGSLAVQCRDEDVSLSLLAPIHDRGTALAVTAERAFLAGLGGGCSVPVAAYAYLEDDILHARGRVSATDGSRQIDVSISGEPEQAKQLGAELASMALGQGADALLAT
jgi:hydroxymethylbilane synthase